MIHGGFLSKEGILFRLERPILGIPETDSFGRAVGSLGCDDELVCDKFVGCDSGLCCDEVGS